jgi:hypothetical protein
MLIVGCDLHTRYQQIAMMDRETGEVSERRLEHESGEARAFYAALPLPVRVKINLRRLLADLALQLRDAVRFPTPLAPAGKGTGRRFAKLLPPAVQQVPVHFQRPGHLGDRRAGLQPLERCQRAALTR